ncbi:MAG: hypothetical protein L7R84_03980 [Balneolaceae bacterium]|nr:hypothetical protein [Balneolaceae bacterium]
MTNLNTLSERTLRRHAEGLNLQLSTRAGMYALFQYKYGYDGGYQGWDIHPSCWGPVEYPLTLCDVSQILQDEKQQALNS